VRPYSRSPAASRPRSCAYTRLVKPIRGGLLSVIGAVLALLATAGTSWAAYPGANGLIAYSTEDIYRSSSSGEIFTIPPAGDDPTQLTDNAIADTEPSWSADGRRLTFIRGSDYVGQNQNVWIMRADGTHQRQVTHGTTPESSPSFSPGGARIVMTRGWNTQGNIVIVRTDGTDPVQLTYDREARDPAFSPNGRRIVFAGAPREERPRGIWVMRPDGTHKRRLARDPNHDNPDFDPDGSHLVFHRLHNCDPHTCDDSVILMRSDGRRKRVITDTGEEPVFSPNGHRIAAVRVSCNALTETCNSKLLSFDRHGTDGRVVTDSISSPSWQPIAAPGPSR
jgi:Tol biopolymer transport system component